MWIAIFVVFMLFVTGGVVAFCVIYSRNGGSAVREQTKEIDENVKDDVQAKTLEDDNDGEYEKVFPCVMIDENDETVDDNDKFLDDLIFMDLIDED